VDGSTYQILAEKKVFFSFSLAYLKTLVVLFKVTPPSLLLQYFQDIYPKSIDTKLVPYILQKKSF